MRLQHLLFPFLLALALALRRSASATAFASVAPPALVSGSNDMGVATLWKIVLDPSIIQEYASYEAFVQADPHVAQPTAQQRYVYIDVRSTISHAFYRARALARWLHPADLVAAKEFVHCAVRTSLESIVDSIHAAHAGDTVIVKLVQDDPDVRPVEKQATIVKRDKKELARRVRHALKARKARMQQSSAPERRWKDKEIDFPLFDPTEFPNACVVKAQHEADPFIAADAHKVVADLEKANTPLQPIHLTTMGIDGDVLVSVRAETSEYHLRPTRGGGFTVVSRSALEQHHPLWRRLESLEAVQLAVSMSGTDYILGIYGAGLKTILGSDDLVEFCNGRNWRNMFELARPGEQRDMLITQFRDELFEALKAAKLLSTNDFEKAEKDDELEAKAREGRCLYKPTTAQRRVRLFNGFTLERVANAISTALGEGVETGSKSDWLAKAVADRLAEIDTRVAQLDGGLYQNLTNPYGPTAAKVVPNVEDEDLMDVDEADLSGAAAREPTSSMASTPSSNTTAEAELARLNGARRARRAKRRADGKKAHPYQFSLSVFSPRSIKGVVLDIYDMARTFLGLDNVEGRLEKAREAKAAARAKEQADGRAGKVKGKKKAPVKQTTTKQMRAQATEPGAQKAKKGGKSSAGDGSQVKARALRRMISVPIDQATRDLIIKSDNNNERAPGHAMADLLTLYLAQHGFEMDFVVLVVNDVRAEAFKMSPLHPLLLEMSEDTVNHLHWRRIVGRVIKVAQGGIVEAVPPSSARPSRTEATRQSRIQQLVEADLGLFTATSLSRKEDADTEGDNDKIKDWKKTPIWSKLERKYQQKGDHELKFFVGTEVPPFIFEIVQRHLRIRAVEFPVVPLAFYDAAIDQIARNDLLSARKNSLKVVERVAKHLSRDFVANASSFVMDLCARLGLPHVTPPNAEPMSDAVKAFLERVRDDPRPHVRARLAGVLNEALLSMPFAGAEGPVQSASSDGELVEPGDERGESGGEDGESGGEDGESGRESEGHDDAEVIVHVVAGRTVQSRDARRPVTSGEAWQQSMLNRIYAVLHRLGPAPLAPRPTKRARTDLRQGRLENGTWMRFHNGRADTTMVFTPAPGDDAANAAYYIVRVLLNYLRPTLGQHLDAVARKTWSSDAGAETLAGWHKGNVVGRTGLELALVGSAWSKVIGDDLRAVSQRGSSLQVTPDNIPAMIRDGVKVLDAYICNVNSSIDALNSDLQQPELDLLSARERQVEDSSSSSRAQYRRLSAKFKAKVLPEALYMSHLVDVESDDARVIPGVRKNDERVEALKALERLRLKVCPLLHDCDDAAVALVDLLFKVPARDRLLPHGFIMVTASHIGFLMLDVGQLKNADTVEQSGSPRSYINRLLEKAAPPDKSKDPLNRWCASEPTIKFLKRVNENVQERVGRQGELVASAARFSHERDVGGRAYLHPHDKYERDVIVHRQISFAINLVAGADAKLKLEWTTTAARAVGGRVRGCRDPGEREAIGKSLVADVGARNTMSAMVEQTLGPVVAASSSSAPDPLASTSASSTASVQVSSVGVPASSTFSESPSSSSSLEKDAIWVGGLDAGERNLTAMSLMNSRSGLVYHVEVKNSQFLQQDKKNRVELEAFKSRSATSQLLKVAQIVGPTPAGGVYYTAHALLQRLEQRNPGRLGLLKTQHIARQTGIEQLGQDVCATIVDVVRPTGSASTSAGLVPPATVSAPQAPSTKPKLLLYMGFALKGRSRQATGANRSNAVSDALVHALEKVPELEVHVGRVDEYLTSKTCPNTECRASRVGKKEEPEELGHPIDDDYGWNKLRLLQCKHCLVVFNRDVVGAVNVAYVGLFGSLVAKVSSAFVHLFDPVVEGLLDFAKRPGAAKKAAAELAQQKTAAKAEEKVAKGKGKGKAKQ